jgi:methylglutaconyl-CoA hydratase
MTNSKEQGHVHTSIANGIATIEFYHPLSNSLPGVLLKKIAETILEMGMQNEISVIVLKSTGEKAFCAGASFDELSRISSPEEGKIFFNGFAQVINAARKCPKIIMGRIQGKAVGGGVGILACTDYCFATTSADVKLSELAIGIGPFVVGPIIERKIGLANTSCLTLNACEWKSAAWAKEKGLYAEIYDNIPEMDEALKSLALKLSKSNPDALKALKKTFWEGTDHWDELLSKRAEISGKLVLSEFTQEALKNFKK